MRLFANNELVAWTVCGRVDLHLDAPVTAKSRTVKKKDIRRMPALSVGYSGSIECARGAVEQPHGLQLWTSGLDKLVVLYLYPARSDGQPVQEMLQTSWDRCWKSMSAAGDGHALMNRLIEAYNEPHRKYHTEQHLRECLGLLSKHSALAVELAEVEAAIWFHDAIYNVRGADNEAKSAEWAGHELRQAGVAEPRISRVTGHILATRHSALPQGQDQMLVVDVDLSILGADRPRFEEYEQQVREEYGWVPWFIYRRKRRQVLSEFLCRRPIYNTPELRGALEQQARSNLAYSLQQLEG